MWGETPVPAKNPGEIINLDHLHFPFQTMSSIKASHKKILEDLLKKECNKVCADCGAKGKSFRIDLDDFSRTQMGLLDSWMLHLHSLLGYPS